MSKQGQDEGAFDANAFEKAQAKQKGAANDTALKDQLLNVVDSWTCPADGQDYPVTVAMVQNAQVRGMIVKVVQILDPKAHTEYLKLRYGKAYGHPELKYQPTLAERRAAYEFAFKRYLELTYTVPGL
jgi:hypothetical protein